MEIMNDIFSLFYVWRIMIKNSFPGISWLYLLVLFEPRLNILNQRDIKSRNQCTGCRLHKMYTYRDSINSLHVIPARRLMEITSWMLIKSRRLQPHYILGYSFCVEIFPILNMLREHFFVVSLCISPKCSLQLLYVVLRALRPYSLRTNRSTRPS